MKIIRARIFLVRSEGLRPVILELTASDGTIGLGEAAIAYGSGNTAAAGMIKDLCERFVMNTDPFQIERIVSDIYDQSFWTKNGGAIVGAGVSAIEQALWDIKARVLQVPVYEMLGGRVRDELGCYANGWYFGCESETAVFSAAEDVVKDGYSALKMYPLASVQANGTLLHPARRGAENSRAVRDAIRRVAGVRNAIGADVRLMLDLGGGLSIGDTIEFCRGVEEYGIEFVEEPTDAGDLPALKQLSEHTSIPIATGERTYMRYGFRDLLESRCVSIIQPDIGNTGGIGEARKIAAMADAYSVKVQPHICGSSLATAVAMHFSACSPNFYIQEHFPYWKRIPGFVEIAANPLEPNVVEGRMPVRDSPGYGIALDYDALANSVWHELNG